MVEEISEAHKESLFDLWFNDKVGKPLVKVYSII